MIVLHMYVDGGLTDGGWTFCFLGKYPPSWIYLVWTVGLNNDHPFVAFPLY